MLRGRSWMHRSRHSDQWVHAGFVAVARHAANGGREPDCDGSLGGRVSGKGLHQPLECSRRPTRMHFRLFLFSSVHEEWRTVARLTSVGCEEWRTIARLRRPQLITPGAGWGGVIQSASIGGVIALRPLPHDTVLKGTMVAVRKVEDWERVPVQCWLLAWLGQSCSGRAEMLGVSFCIMHPRQSIVFSVHGQSKMGQVAAAPFLGFGRCSLGGEDESN